MDEKRGNGGDYLKQRVGTISTDRSDDLVVDLVGRREGERENRAPPCERRRREGERKNWSGWAGARGQNLSECVAPLPRAPHFQSVAPARAAPLLLPRRIGVTSSASTGHVGWMCGARARSATWACVAPVRRAPHKRVRSVK